MLQKPTILFSILLLSFSGFSQSKFSKDTAAIHKLLEESKGLSKTDSARAISIAVKARKNAADIKYKKGEALALKNMGMVYYHGGHYVETLNYWNQSLEKFENIKDEAGIANILGNIGAIYLTQGADEKALEYSLKSLQLAEKLKDTIRLITTLSNVGGIYHNKKDPVALNYLLKVIPLVKAIGQVESYVVITGNIGEIYFDHNDVAKALEYYQISISAAGKDISAAFAYNGIGKIHLSEKKFQQALEAHNKALESAKKADDKLQVVRSLRGIADVHSKTGRTELALNYYQQAKSYAENMDDINVELKDLYKDMALAFSNGKDFSNAFLYQTFYSDLKDTLYNIETKKKLNQLQFDFELSKKESELSLKEASIKSERQARIGITIGLVLILLIAFIIYRSYLQKAKTNKILDKQKVQIEHLLLNILPKEVVYELQTTGESAPRHFEEVSVLFSDFKGFTAIADKTAPGDLVEELNKCFMAFDNIMEKYGLERIKTIGDSYMCAGNIPSPTPDHTYKMIKAAMDMQDFMAKHNTGRAEKGMELLEIRIGVHTGPVVAGVVGKKKYAYDIWGSTVNIASRMESNGAPGRVNITAQTYEMIKDRFDCSHRGKIHVKNLGELDMYFVEAEKFVGEVKIILKGIEKEKVGLENFAILDN